MNTDHASDDASDDASAAQQHREQAIAVNNATWGLLDGVVDGTVSGEELLDAAHAASHHWTHAAGRTLANAARSAWLLSRCYAVTGHGDLALSYAERSARFVAEAGLADFDLGYVHEARARSLACLGRLDEAAAELEAARSVDIADDEDRGIFLADLDAAPWFGLTTS